jgi:hypothetical protein
VVLAAATGTEPWSCGLRSEGKDPAPLLNVVDAGRPSSRSDDSVPSCKTRVVGCWSQSEVIATSDLKATAHVKLTTLVATSLLQT